MQIPSWQKLENVEPSFHFSSLDILGSFFVTNREWSRRNGPDRQQPVPLLPGPNVNTIWRLDRLRQSRSDPLRRLQDGT